MADFFPGLEARINRWADGVRAQATNALKEEALDAEEGVREIIHTSVTDWGRERVAGLHGDPRPYPGRIESGEMIGNVDSQVDEVDRDVHEARWGWIHDFEDYYAVQDASFKRHDTKIVPMEALRRTLDRAEDSFKGRLDNLEVSF